MQGLHTLARDGDGFRLRGGQPTRLDTFVGAAFAVTLVVVSFDAMPGSIGGRLQALQQTPAFVASFAILAVVCLAHRRFSHRIALQGGWFGVVTERQPKPARAAVQAGAAT